MLDVIVTEKSGRSQRFQFDKSEVSIGRIPGNDIVLPKSNISKRHARIVTADAGPVVIDAKSTNGTYVNGTRIDEPVDLREGDRIFIGDFTIEVQGGTPARQPSPPPPLPASVAPPAEQRGPGEPPKGEWNDDWAHDDAAAPEPGLYGRTAQGKSPPPPEPPQSPAAAASAPSAREPIVEAPVAAPEPLPPAPPQSAGDAAAPGAMHLATRLQQTLELGRSAPPYADDRELCDRARQTARALLENAAQRGELPEGQPAEALVEDLLGEALGIGPLEDLLQDESVTEILVNGPERVFVERGGKLAKTERGFANERAALGFLARLLAPLGRRLDPRVPVIEARLPAGARLHAVLPPIALQGPCFTLRKRQREPLQIDDLVATGCLTPDVAAFLESCVVARKSIVVTGGAGAGKTTTLNVLAGFIAPEERIITVEETAELALEHENVINLEARPPDAGGAGAVSVRDLMRQAMRLRPDRIVVGECRRGEALEILQAMSTELEGSLTTLHAYSPRDGLSRLETMVLVGGLDVPLRAVRAQIASAVDLVVHQTRFADGTRKVTQVSEVLGLDGDAIALQDLFVLEPATGDEAARAAGRLQPTGAVPRFFEALVARGLRIDLGIFQES